MACISIYIYKQLPFSKSPFSISRFSVVSGKQEIDDPSDNKPSDWVDDPKMDDPEASKPASWIQHRLMMFVSWSFYILVWFKLFLVFFLGGG